MWQASLLILLVSLLSSANAAISFTDAKGQVFKFARPVETILTLAPHLTELVYAAGAGNKIIATVEYSDYPESAKQIPRIGNAMQIDLEAVIQLKPDLVLAWLSGNGSLDLRRLNDFSIPVFYTDAKQLQDIPRLISEFGKIANTRETASKAVIQFNRTYQDLVEDYAKKPVISVYYQIWNQPRMTINGKHLISDIIHVCGGKNVFADLTMLVPRLGIEAVIKANPQVIITSAINEHDNSQVQEWRQWGSLQAVKNNHLYSIPPDLMHRHSPRILQGAKLLCTKLDQAR